MTLDISKTLLLAVDVQNDFCPAYTAEDGQEFPEGALAVPAGGDVVAPLNLLAAAFARAGARVAATQDWHPAGHCSFAAAHPGKKPGDFFPMPGAPGQTLWPEHCVQGSRGAAFHSGFNLQPVNLIIRKGFRQNLDSYSAFFENDRATGTGLEGWARSLDIQTVVIGGLATDYCVFYSAADSAALGFRTIIISDAVRGVNFPAGSVADATSTMKGAGIAFAPAAALLEGLR